MQQKFFREILRYKNTTKYFLAISTLKNASPNVYIKFPIVNHKENLMFPINILNLIRGAMFW